MATFARGLTTLVDSVLLRFFDLSNVVMLFLLTVVFVSLKLGSLAGAWAAVLCGCFDFFFVPPRFTFATMFFCSSGVLGCVVVFALGMVVGRLVVVVRRSMVMGRGLMVMFVRRMLCVSH